VVFKKAARPSAQTDDSNERGLAIDRSLQFGASYAWSVLVTAVAALVRAGLGPFLGDHYPLGTFYAAVAVIGWFWGVGPAVLAAVLGYLAGAYLFLTPRAPPFGPEPHALEFLVYGLICSALIALVYRVYERQRRLDQALRAHASTRQTLVESDARFKRYLDALPDIVYTWKADGSQEYVNPRWAEYVGAPPMSNEAAAAVPADDAQVLREERDGALRRGEPFRTQFRLRDRHGHLRWFLTRCVPIRDPNNSIMGWVGTSIDVDDEKRAAEALELSERRYRSVSEAFDFGMWSADSAGRFTFVSPRLLGFLGVTLEGVTLEQVEVHVWSAIQRARVAKPPHGGNAARRPASPGSGSTRFVALTARFAGCGLAAYRFEARPGSSVPGPDFILT
jgi:PAS domain S-box-containing protein